MKLKITGDGTHTLYNPELDDHYHSVFGAISESRHVFIENGLLLKGKQNRHLSILEIGFGTGLNTLLTLERSIIDDLSIDYYAIEAFPLAASIWKELNYIEHLDTSKLKEMFYAIHEASWDKTIKINTGFSLTKLDSKLENAVLPELRFDVVYYDAFAPDKQPELWTEGIFRKIYKAMKSEGMLTTYSAKGSVKRALKASGFVIESLPGPPGKREMIRALKPA